LCVYLYAKHEHGTGIAGVSKFLFRNLTSVLISLYPCSRKDLYVDLTKRTELKGGFYADSRLRNILYHD